MDKSNIAIALITGLLAVYIAVALVLSRVHKSRLAKTKRRSQADPHRVTDPKHKRSGPWTSFSS